MTHEKIMVAGAIAFAGVSLIVRELKKISFSGLDFNYEYKDDANVYDLSEETIKKD